MRETHDESPPGLRERKKQQTRRLIAETARQLFAERGFERVTVAEVARAADVSQQTVFNYFPTKEDLVFWRLGAFEDDLLATVRDRSPGESALAAFRRFVLGGRGLLRSAQPEAREQLAALTRTIDESPALLAREQQIFAGYTDALATLLAEETSADAGDIEPWIAANAMMGVHRALVRHARGRVRDGARHPALAKEIRAGGEQAFALLELGLGSYAVGAPRGSG
ncbi:MAG TPA: TetR family transcriptional regulator [Baekduia sp.]|uniref:TetR family transcriptional regulator n=1 Tax=Baekduia sp. TaxID=2600305 RepID=UPI002BE2AC20|nr:TetR family transcriptional regulator [Baekduia sp.]HMJ35394.1 TetR family transcriptional regulator [Baekduia sp.]